MCECESDQFVGFGDEGVEVVAQVGCFAHISCVEGWCVASRGEAAKNKNRIEEVEEVRQGEVEKLR